MRKYITTLSFLLTFGLVAAVGLHADDVSFKVPQGQDGKTINDVAFSGGIYTIVSDTAAVVTNPCLLSLIVMPEGAATAGWDIFDATATVNNTDANRVLPTVEHESTTLPTYRAFDPPLRLNVGLSVDIINDTSNVAASSSTFVCTAHLE